MGSLTAPDPITRAAGSGRPATNHSARSAMRIVRPQPAGLRCRVRLADGRLFTGALPPARHRAIQLGMLHAETAELVELTPGTRSVDGKLALDRRRRPEHYLPGGAAGRGDWLAPLLAHAEQIVTGAYATARAGAGPREEAFVGVAPRTHRRGDKHAIAHSRFLWVDVDVARRAAGAVGAAGRAAVSPADRIRRLRRRPRVLEARRATGGDTARAGDR